MKQRNQPKKKRNRSILNPEIQPIGNVQSQMIYTYRSTNLKVHRNLLLTKEIQKKRLGYRWIQ